MACAECNWGLLEQIERKSVSKHEPLGKGASKKRSVKGQTNTAFVVKIFVEEGGHEKQIIHKFILTIQQHFHR